LRKDIQIIRRFGKAMVDWHYSHYSMNIIGWFDQSEQWLNRRDWWTLEAAKWISAWWRE